MIECLYEPFKHWTKKGSIYILSDLHFDDSNCRYMDENWIEPIEQIKILNKYITKNDTFICLGDVGNEEYIKALKAGHKVLIMGNHDSYEKIKNVFDEIYKGPLFISNKLLLSHEPIYGLESFCMNIHGHDHNAKGIFSDFAHINLAANICMYTPFNLGKAIKNGILSDIDDIHRITIDKAILMNEL